MGWVPDSMWLTYYDVSTPAGELEHDLAVSTHAGTLPSARMAGFSVPASPTAPALVPPGAARGRAASCWSRAAAASHAGGVVTRRCAPTGWWSTTVTVVLVLLGAGAVVLASAGASSPTAARRRRSDPAPSPCASTSTGATSTRVRPGPIRVRPHTEVRFVVVNHDPIGHELIVGGPDVQARHASGHEAYHPPVPGEVSVPAEGRASTTYVFHAPGPVEYACHLPGHYQYGMHGIVEVVADGPGALSACARLRAHGTPTLRHPHHRHRPRRPVHARHARRRASASSRS